MFREFRLSLPLPPPSFLRLSVRLFLPILFFISPTLSIVVWGKNMELRPGMFVFVDGKRSRVNRTQTRSKVARKEYAREFCVHCSRWKQTQVEELFLKFVQHRIIIFLSTILSIPSKKKKDEDNKEERNRNRIVENSIYLQNLSPPISSSRGANIRKYLER